MSLYCKKLTFKHFSIKNNLHFDQQLVIFIFNLKFCVFQVQLVHEKVKDTANRPINSCSLSILLSMAADKYEKNLHFSGRGSTLV